MTNAEIYINKYKELEEVVRSTFNLRDTDSISYYLTNNSKYNKYKDDIKYCQDVRNLLQHRPKINNQYPIEPHNEMIQLISNLILQIKQRAKCFDVCIKTNKMFTETLDGSVKQTMNVMRDKLYTHIPILENDVIIGVFDENALFSYLANEEIVSIDDSLTFRDILSFINMNNREMEEFIFIKKNLYVDELQSKFEEAFHKGKRVGAAFLTEKGKETENVLGLITPWDIISK